LIKKIIQTTIVILLLTTNFAYAVELNNHHPNRYVVKKGDTLWGIATKFLKNPWDWLAVWQSNTGVRNPNYIYPGDVLVLRAINGKPKIIAVNHENKPTSAQSNIQGVIKLSPKTRQQEKMAAINTIPVSAIKPFLSRNRLITEDEYEQAPYIIALSHQEHLIGGDDQAIFVRGLKKPEPIFYSIFRKEDKFISPKSKKFLGFEGRYIGSVKLNTYADPATFMVLALHREIQVGDRLFAQEPIMPPHFTLHPAPAGISGQIIDVDGGVSRIGQYNIVTIDLGSNAGIAPGYVFDIIKAGRIVNDKYSAEPERVRLPAQTVGELLVFKTYNSVSYALIMKAYEALQVGEQIGSPLKNR
jgi:hypothetical protein